MKRKNPKKPYKALLAIPAIGTLFLSDPVFSQVINWNNLNWPAGTLSQSYTVGCPGNINTVTFTFSGDIAPGRPNLDNIGPDGTSLSVAMAGRSRNRNSQLRIDFTNPIILGTLRIHDIDLNDFAGPKPLNQIWVDEVQIEGSGINPTLTPQLSTAGRPSIPAPPGPYPTPYSPNVVNNPPNPFPFRNNGTGNNPINSGTAVLVNPNYGPQSVATGIGDGSNLTAEGTVTADFGTNPINVIQLNYRNGQISPVPVGSPPGQDFALIDNDNDPATPDVPPIQAISIGNIDFANPCITVSKQAGTPTQVSPGVFTIPYTIRVRNPGNVPIQNVQLDENFASSSQLNLTLGSAPLALGQYRIIPQNNLPSSSTITNPGTVPTSPVTAPASQLNVNPSFNGSTNTSILGAGSVLRAGAEGTVTVNLEIRPLNVSQPLNNIVTASGSFTPPGSNTPITVTNTSVNGPTPPTNPNTPGTNTPVRIPQIGTAKTIGAAQPVTGQPGVFDVQYVITVQNTGSETLNNVQVVENFKGVLQPGGTQDPLWSSLNYVASNAPAVGQYTIVGTPTVSGSLTAPNAATNSNKFTGNGSAPNTNLLAATGNTLLVGQSGTVTFTARVYPDPSRLPAALKNQVQGAGTGANSNTTVTDPSVNGTKPDANGNGNPTDDQSPTPVTLPPGPRIGVAKALGTVTDAGGGKYNIQYNIRVQNYGSTALSNVQVTEDFAQQFRLTQVAANPGPGQFSVITAPVGSGTLSGNAAFTGSVGNIGLLNPSGSTLAIGQSETISLTIQVNPATLPVTLNNQVTASGTDPANPNNPVTDQSVNGAEGDRNPNPDPNDNNIPDEQSFTPVTLPPRPTLPPKIGVAKAVGLPKDIGGGVYEIPYTIRVQNYGGVLLNNVQVIENFQGILQPSGAPDPGWSSLSYTPNATPTSGQYTIQTAPNTTAATLSANTGFNGSGDVNLLTISPTNTLAVGQSETIRFVVRVNPASTPVTLNNQVRASGTDPNNTPVTDDSADDANNPGNPNPDSNSDGNPNNDTKPTPITLPPAPTPRIGVGKSATSIVDATPGNTADGLFDVTYAINVQNAGNVSLSSVQVNEPFATQFGLTYTPGAPGVGEYTITAPPSTAAPLAANGGFTGSGTNVGMLNPGGSSLAVGQSQVINVGVRVNIDPATFPFILDNQVTGTGTGAGQTVQDKSNDGTSGQNPGNPNPAPGGGSPTDGDNNTPTRISLPPNQPIPRIGTAKSAPNTTPPILVLGDGRFNIPYTIVVENSGTDALNNVQVTENFEAANPLGFGLTYTSGTPAPGQYTLIGTPSTSSPLSINPAFTGSPSGSINILDAANSTLPIGQRREINFVVQVFPTSIPVTLNNQAQASGTGAQSGRGVTDDSVDGLDTSPDGNLNPNDDTKPTPVLLPPRGLSTGGNFLLVKRITNVTRNGQAIPGLDFSTFTDDPNDSGDNTLNSTNLKPLGLLEVPGLQSGDEVEYTVYYLSAGSQPVTNARVCDLVPERTTFIPNTFGGDKGILLRQGAAETAQTNAADGDNGQYLAPLAPVDRIIPPCPTGTSNPNGAVFSKLGDLPNAGPNQTGFLRFRVRID